MPILYDPDISIAGPSTILRRNYADLTEAITSDLYRIANKLYSKELISFETLNYIQTATGISDSQKAGQLVSKLQAQLKSSANPEDEIYLTKVCHVFRFNSHKTCPSYRIASCMLQQLGKCSTL